MSCTKSVNKICSEESGKEYECIYSFLADYDTHRVKGVLQNFTAREIVITNNKGVYVIDTNNIRCLRPVKW